MRLDKFLKVSRLIKRRTVANEACDAGRVLVNGKTAKAKQAMQSLFISCPQALDEMTLTHKTDFYESKNVRAYLKTRKGVYFKELTGETKKERFLEMLMRNVTEEVNFRH